MISYDFHNHSLTKKCTHFTDEGMRLKEMQVSSQDGTQTQDCLVSKTLIQYRMNFCRALCASYDPHTIYKKDSFFLWVKRQNFDAWQPWTPSTVATLDPF